MEDIEALGFIRRRKNFEKYPLREEYFASDVAREIFRTIKNFFQKYPEKEVVSKKNLKLEIEATGEEKKILYETIRAIPLKIDEEVGARKIREFIQTGIARRLIYENLNSLESKGSVNVQSFISGLREIESIQTHPEETVKSYVEEIESFHQVYHTSDKSFLTGVKLLDETLRIPPTVGEEWIVIGPPGRGKTQMLLNICFRAAEQGANVLYITTGDQGFSRVVKRLNSIVSGISWRKLEDPTARVAGLLRKRMRENILEKGGDIKIQDWSDTSCTPSDIESLVCSKEYDVVAVDYPDIMLPDYNSRYKERRHEIAAIFSSLRRMAGKYGFLLWCGSQANRSSLDKQVITMKDVAEDIQKCWVADGIISLCQTQEEKEESTARIFIAKVRRPPLADYIIPVEIDEETGRIL